MCVYSAGQVHLLSFMDAWHYLLFGLGGSVTIWELKRDLKGIHPLLWRVGFLHVYATSFSQTNALLQPIVPSLQQPPLGTAWLHGFLAPSQLVILRLTVWCEHIVCSFSFTAWFVVSQQHTSHVSFTVTPESKCGYHIKHLGHCIFNGISIIKEARPLKGDWCVVKFPCLWQFIHTDCGHLVPTGVATVSILFITLKHALSSLQQITLKFYVDHFVCFFNWYLELIYCCCVTCSSWHTPTTCDIAILHIISAPTRECFFPTFLKHTHLFFVALSQPLKNR